MANLGRKLELWRLLVGAREGVGVREIALRLGVSKSTAQRDIDELSRAGVGVEEERRGQALRYRVRGTPPTELEIDAAVLGALEAAEVALAGHGELRLARTLRTLRSRLSDPGPPMRTPPMSDGPGEGSSTRPSGYRRRGAGAGRPAAIRAKSSTDRDTN